MADYGRDMLGDRDYPKATEEIYRRIKQQQPPVTNHRGSIPAQNKIEEIVLKYWDEKLAPDLVKIGMPADGVALLRRNHLATSMDSPEAIQQLLEMYFNKEAPFNE